MNADGCPPAWFVWGAVLFFAAFGCAVVGGYSAILMLAAVWTLNPVVVTFLAVGRSMVYAIAVNGLVCLVLFLGPAISDGAWGTLCWMIGISSALAFSGFYAVRTGIRAAA